MGIFKYNFLSQVTRQLHAKQNSKINQPGGGAAGGATGII
jgi:hypothetical protein